MQGLQVWSPGLARSPGVRNGNPPQYSYLENSMDRGAWWATVHGIPVRCDNTRAWIHSHTHTHSEKLINRVIEYTKLSTFGKKVCIAKTQSSWNFILGNTLKKNSKQTSVATLTLGNFLLSPLSCDSPFFLLPSHFYAPLPSNCYLVRMQHTLNTQKELFRFYSLTLTSLKAIFLKGYGSIPTRNSKASFRLILEHML